MSEGILKTPVLSAVEVMKIKFTHERHEAHEDAQAFKRDNRIFGWLNYVFQRELSCSN